MIMKKLAFALWLLTLAGTSIIANFPAVIAPSDDDTNTA